MGPFPRWALTMPVLDDKRMAVPFVCLRLSLGGPWGAAQFLWSAFKFVFFRKARWL